MNKKKILKIIGIVLLIIIVIVLIHTIRNYIIITNLQNKVSKYTESTNYYTKSISTKNGMKVTIEYYKKDKKEVLKLERDFEGKIAKITNYNNGERVDTFWDSEEEKKVKLNNNTAVMKVNIYNFLETDSKWQTFLSSITAKIKSTECNGKQCYEVKGFLSTTSLTEKGSKVYIEKDTGLYVKAIGDNMMMEREYEFDNVDDSIFVEPDVSQYSLDE